MYLEKPGTKFWLAEKDSFNRAKNKINNKKKPNVRANLKSLSISISCCGISSHIGHRVFCSFGIIFGRGVYWFNLFESCPIRVRWDEDQEKQQEGQGGVVRDFSIYLIQFEYDKVRHYITKPPLSLWKSLADFCNEWFIFEKESETSNFRSVCWKL